jgi:hypothetical protein
MRDPSVCLGLILSACHRRMDPSSPWSLDWPVDVIGAARLRFLQLWFCTKTVGPGYAAV